MKIDYHRLALGSAQFGLAYGISNQAGKVPPQEIEKILALAQRHGILSIDTAAAYGDSERVLGAQDISHFKIYTKIGGGNLRLASLSKAEIIALVAQRFENLGLSHMSASLGHKAHELKAQAPRSQIGLDGLFLHRFEDLFDNGGTDLWNTLVELKSQGLIKKIGVSAYTPEEVDRVLRLFPIDLIQLPMNIFDQRLSTHKSLEALKQHGVEIHIRSAFLQGLLLMPQNEAIKALPKAESMLLKWHAFLQENKHSALPICLAYLKSQTLIDKIVLGVESAAQLQEIITAYAQNIDLDWHAFSCSDETIIDPRLWNKSS